VFEGPFIDNNQNSAASEITNVPADLVVESVTVTPVVFSGEYVDVTWTVRNIGAAAVYAGTRQWNDIVMFSTQSNFVSGAVAFLGSQLHLATTVLQPGESYTTTARFRVPEGIEGDYYIHVATDPNVGFHPKFNINLNGTGTGRFPDWPSLFAVRVWEGATKANNTRSAAVHIVYREADLRLVSVATPAQTQSGGTFTVTWDTRNDGTRSTRSDVWVDRVYLSRDTSIDASDKIIGSLTHRGFLAPGESYSGTMEVRMPDDIEGDFHLIVITNAGYGGGPGDNPARFPGTITLTNRPMLNEYRDTASNVLIRPIDVEFVPGPDLVVSLVTSSERVFTGREFTVTYTVSNTGVGATPDRQSDWMDQVYLSRDRQLPSS
jgi:hypothetical protein